MAFTTHDFSLQLKADLFEQVREHLQIGLSRLAGDKEVTAFLMRHPALLGSIIEYDEVDTEDRSRIWEHCRSWRYTE